MIFRLFKRMLFGAWETLAVVLLVLVFFAVALTALTLSFPSGSGLQDLYGDLVVPGQAASSSVGLGTGETGFVAMLTSVTRQVQERPVNAVAWTAARAGSQMGDHHAVQTAARSSATISFENRGSLELDENSLVVIKRSSARRGLRRRGASLVLLGGEVRGRLETETDGDLPLDIVTAGAQTQILGGDEPAEFQVTVNPDNTSTLSLTSGSAEVTAGGQTVTVGPDHSLTIDPAGPLGQPTRILRAPRLAAPADGDLRAYGEVLAEVEFRWSALAGAEAYRLTIARDPGLEDVVHTEELATAGFVHGNLGEGQYYWGVAALNGGSAGDLGSVRSFRLVEDLEPPRLEVVLPESVEDTDRLVVRGRTEPGATVMIGMDSVSTDATGAFEYAVSLRPGPNVVVVEAVDAVGNVAYSSQYVNAKYQQSIRRD